MLTPEMEYGALRLAAWEITSQKYVITSLINFALFLPITIIQAWNGILFLLVPGASWNLMTRPNI